MLNTHHYFDYLLSFTVTPFIYMWLCVIISVSTPAGLKHGVHKHEQNKPASLCLLIFHSPENRTEIKVQF